MISINVSKDSTVINLHDKAYTDSIGDVNGGIDILEGFGFYNDTS